MRVMSSVSEVSVTRAPTGRLRCRFSSCLDARRDDVVAAGAVLEDPELVLHFPRTVDRDGDPDLVLDQELDHVRLEQRGVGRQAEVDVLAERGGALLRVGDGLFQHREVEERLAAEESQVRDLVGARLLEHEVDALARRLLRHELRLAAVLGVDNLVFAVLVAVGAAQIALVGDVQHHRGERERRQRQHLRRRRRAPPARRSPARAPAR